MKGEWVHASSSCSCCKYLLVRFVAARYRLGAMPRFLWASVSPFITQVDRAWSIHHTRGNDDLAIRSQSGPRVRGHLSMQLFAITFIVDLVTINFH